VHGPNVVLLLDVQAGLASVTCDLRIVLHKAEQLVVTTKSWLANEQARYQTPAGAFLEARAQQGGILLFVASVVSAVSCAHAPLIIRQQPTTRLALHYKSIDAVWCTRIWISPCIASLCSWFIIQ